MKHHVLEADRALLSIKATLFSMIDARLNRRVLNGAEDTQAKADMQEFLLQSCIECRKPAAQHIARNSGVLQRRCCYLRGVCRIHVSNRLYKCRTVKASEAGFVKVLKLFSQRNNFYMKAFTLEFSIINFQINPRRVIVNLRVLMRVFLSSSYSELEEGTFDVRSEPLNCASCQSMGYIPFNLCFNIKQSYAGLLSKVRCVMCNCSVGVLNISSSELCSSLYQLDDIADMRQNHSRNEAGNHMLTASCLMHAVKMRESQYTVHTGISNVKRYCRG